MLLVKPERAGNRDTSDKVKHTADYLVSKTNRLTGKQDHGGTRKELGVENGV